MKMEWKRVDRRHRRDVGWVERYWGGVGVGAGEVDGMWGGEVLPWVQGGGGRVKEASGGVIHRRGGISTRFVEN
jgi:hypothetical protein